MENPWKRDILTPQSAASRKEKREFIFIHHGALGVHPHPTHTDTHTHTHTHAHARAHTHMLTHIHYSADYTELFSRVWGCVACVAIATRGSCLLGLWSRSISQLPFILPVNPCLETTCRAFNKHSAVSSLLRLFCTQVFHWMLS